MKQSVGKETLNLYLRTIAHELRNPLVSVQGFATLLAEKYARNLPGEGKKYLERILANLSRVDYLLNDLNKLAAVSVCEQDFVKVSSLQLIRDVLDTFALQIQQNEIEVRVGSHLPDIYCDVTAISVVFSNLIANAIKYSRERTQARIEVGYLDDELFHKFFVRDNGVGFRAKDRNKVFLIFSRLRNKRNVDGSGLGLSIVKQLVEGHGGQVWVESRKYKGATFFFTLPKHAA